MTPLGRPLLNSLQLQLNFHFQTIPNRLRARFVLAGRGMNPVVDDPQSDMVGQSSCVSLHRLSESKICYASRHVPKVQSVV